MAGALALGLLAFGVLTPSASAHPPVVYGGYYGGGVQDYVPHDHYYSTPYGTYDAYGSGTHDYLPHDYYYQAAPYSNGSSSGYAVPYSSGYTVPYNNGYSSGYTAPYYGNGHSYGHEHFYGHGH